MNKPLGITTDTIEVEVNGVEKSLTGTFRDGHAYLADEEGKLYLMTYPSYDEVTPRMAFSIEEYTGRDLEENFEVALKYGKIVQNTPKSAIEDEQRKVVQKMIEYIIEKIKSHSLSGVVISDFIKFNTTFNDEQISITPWILNVEGDTTLRLNCDTEDDGRIELVLSSTAEEYTYFEVSIINYLFSRLDTFVERI